VCTVAISYEPGNDVARKLYASFGFYETGELDEGEVVALLRLRE
jgi:diamine N-acetyltransferase